MDMKRREVLIGGAALAAATGLAGGASGQAPAGAKFAPAPGGWKTYEIRTTLEILGSRGAAQAWIPVSAFTGDGWIRPGETTWSSQGGKAQRVRDPKSGAEMVHVAWPSTESVATVEVVSRFSSQD